MNKKILIVSAIYYPYHLGGAEISTQLLAEGLAKSFEVSVVTHNLTNCVEKLNGVTIFRRNFGLGSRLVINEINNKKNSSFSKFISKLKDIFNNKKSAKVFSNLINEIKPNCIVFSGNCFRMGRRTLISVANCLHLKQVFIIRDPSLLYFKSLRESFSFLDNWYRRKNIKLLKSMDSVIGISNDILQAHINSGFIFKNPCVVPNIIDNNDSFYLKPSEKKKNILYVGMLSKNKGVDFLISSFLKNTILPPETKLILIGGNVDINIPKNDCIINLGKLDLLTTYKIMSENYVVVLPSIWKEAFGRVLVEASFNSTIAIGSKSGAIPELMNYDNDFLFDVLDENCLLSKLRHIFSLSFYEYEENVKKQHQYFEQYNSESVCKKMEFALCDIFKEETK